MLLIDQLAEKYITEAINKGELDNLEGQGKPLQLQDNHYVPEHLRAAYHLLKNAGYLPPELELKKEIQNIEQLMAQTDDLAEQQQLNKRLRYVMTQYNLACDSDVRLEQAYYEKITQKLSGRKD